MSLAVHRMCWPLALVTSACAASGYAGHPATSRTGEPMSGPEVCSVTAHPGADLGAEINACTAALPPAGGVIALPAGTFAFSTPVRITQPNVTVRGAGHSFGAADGATTMEWQGGPSVLFTIDADNVRLERFSLGNRGAGTVAVQVVGGRDGTTLDEMTIAADRRLSKAAFQVPVGRDPADPSTTILLRHCWIENAEIGVDLDNVNNFVSEASAIVYSRTNVRVGPTHRVFGFYFVNGSAAETETSDSLPPAVNIDLISVNTAVITGSYFENVTERAGTAPANQRTLRIRADAENIVFSGNYLNGQGMATYAIADSSATRVTITNNTFNNYRAGAFQSPGTSTTVAYNNVLLGTTPGFADDARGLRLEPEADQSQLGSPSRRWLAHLYAGEMYRSGGDSTRPDLSGNGTSPLVIAGRADGSGRVKLGATTSFSSSAEMFTKRIVARQGTPLTAGDFGWTHWGTRAALSAIAGTDQAFTVTVLAGGRGVGADPVLTLRFADGSWERPPLYVCGMSGGTAAPVPVTWSAGPDTLAVKVHGVPAGGASYTFTCVGFGA